MLTCPETGYSCDVRGGPQPKDFIVLRVNGIKTAVVRYVIECYTNESPKTSQDPQAGRNVILAHRWRQWSDVDEDHFSTVVTAGEAVFNMAELTKQHLLPDQFRQQFGFPVPTNFKRESVHVEPDSDGTRCRYQVVDREQAINLQANSRATRIEAFQTVWASQPSVADVALNAGFSMGDSAINHGWDIFSGFLSGGPIGAASAAGPLIRDGLHTGLHAMKSALPSSYQHYFVRAWGNRASNRSDLMALCLAIIFGRLNALGLLKLPGIELSITQDLMGKFCEAQATFRRNLDAGITGGPFGFAISLPFDFPRNEDLQRPGGILGGLLPGVLPVAGNSDNPAPPNSDGTRGTWVGQLVAQALTAPNAKPGVPVWNDNVDATW